MTPFTYHRPASLGDAVALLGESERQAKVIAGGQSLLLALKERTVRPARLMSLASLPGLKGLRVSETGALEIGATTTYATLSRATLAGWHGEIAAVAGNLADRSVRSVGTVGGALCEANPRYDMPTLMVAAGASLTLVSAQGERVVDAAAFFDPVGGTVLRPSELLVGITVPQLSAFDALVFEKFRQRVFDAALVTVACAIKLGTDGVIESATLVAGAIAKAPLLARETAASLFGQRPDTLDMKALGRAVSAELMPAESLTTHQRRYQAELVISLTARALARITGRNGS